MKYLKILGLAAVAAMALTAILASSASATTLEVTGVKTNATVTLIASLEKNTSALLVDEFGTTTDTCTSSEVKVDTTSPFTVAGKGEIDGTVEALTFGGCSHTTTVIKPGKLFIAWDGGTNGTVTSSEAEVTVSSTFFGASAICKTGTGTHIGTLTGSNTAGVPATIHINASINCGILGAAKWTGSYEITSPHEGRIGVVE